MKVTATLKQAFFILTIALISVSSCTTQRSTAIVDYGKSMQAPPKQEEVADTPALLADSSTDGQLAIDEESIQRSYIERANQALKYYLKAQVSFRNKKYQQALDFINYSLNTEFTADASALKGSILYKMSSTREAVEAWKLAYETNPASINADLPGFRDAYQAFLKNQ